MTSTAELLATISAHLAAFELPPITSIHITASNSAPQVTVQLVREEPSLIAAALLEWADTLTQISAQAWRVPPGDSVHLSVTGLLPGEISILVYGGVWGTQSGPGADLPPGATTTIPLTALRQAATGQEVRA